MFTLATKPSKNPTNTPPLHAIHAPNKCHSAAMAPRSALVELSYTVDSASEDEMARGDLNAMPTPDSNAENKAPARKARGKAAQPTKTAPAKKAVGKAKTTARRASGGSVLGVKKQNAGVTKKAGAKRGRKALAERETGNGSDTEEVDEFAAEEELVKPVEAPKSRRGRPAKTKTLEVEEVEADSIMELPPPARKTRKQADPEPAPKRAAKSKATAKPKASRRAPEPEPEETILETQPDPDGPDPMDVEESIEIDEIPETQPPPPTRPTARRGQAPPRASSKPQAPSHRRAGSASDSERDPALRRKLGEVTKRLEAMTMKYDNLKEVASSTKESNFDQLRKKIEQTTKDQDAVIKALKQQITEMQSRSSELDAMKRSIAKLEKENARIATENKTLATSLTSAQNENKALSTKLAAARSASAPPETSKIPGSAVKSRTVVLPGAPEAAKEAQLRQLKLDLYSDLTGLVICGAKKGEENEDIFDCLQTGRNGSKSP